MLSESKSPTRSPLPHSPFRQRFAETARILADAAVAVLLAPTCAACARCLDQPTAGPVCAECWHAIPVILPPVCDVCGDPLSSWRAMAPGPGQCGRCRRGGGHVRHARAIGAYEGSLRSIVHALKYDGRRSLAPGLATLLAVTGSQLLEGADVAVPVPLHRARQRARGFNQAEDIARRLPIPMTRALERVRRTPSQTDLPEAERYETVRGAFALARRVSVRGAVVIVVDDVSTTGATLDACARVLIDAGAREVRALTVARVVSRRP
jgi:ComF family protein